MTKTEKFCKQCNEILPIDKFYVIGRTFSTLCKFHNNRKKCDHQKLRYVKKPTGFDKLDEEKQKLILEDLHKLNIKQLSIKYEISYPTIRVWKLRDRFPNLVN